MFKFIFLILSNILAYSILNNRIVDDFGRERIFHGVNVIYKKQPWHPITDRFDYIKSFNDDDIKIIKDLGLNIVRLGVMWPGVEPNKGYYNLTYLNIMKSIVDRLNNSNIYVLIDFHQDVLSEYFCGEGIPDWILNNSNFPFPLNNAYNKTGKPSEDYCLSLNWIDYQFTYYAGKVYQQLYTDPMLINYFLGYWNIVIQTFKYSQNVIGYEIMNEPWAGNIYEDPLLLFPEYSDKKYLQSFYNKIYNNISSILNNKLLFFESITWDIYGVGFEYSPCNNTNSCVLSYHCYFPPAISVKQLFTVRMKDIIRLNIGGFLTEMGETNILDVLNYSDYYFQSWTVWQYKLYSNITGDSSMFYYNNGTVMNSIQNLNRIYPIALCGHGIHFNYNKINSKLVYLNNPKCLGNTEIFIKNYSNISINYNLTKYIINNILYIKPHKNVINISIIIFF